MFEKEDFEIIYRALRAYKPREKEEQLYSILVEQIEEILIVDFEMLEFPY